MKEQEGGVRFLQGHKYMYAHMHAYARIGTGSAPLHNYSASGLSCGLKLALDHQLDLAALSKHHTLRVVAVLHPPPVPPGPHQPEGGSPSLYIWNGRLHSPLEPCVTYQPA